MSKIFTKTKLPKNVTTHDLLQKAGFVYQSNKGIVHWLPIGLRTLNKIENVVKSRMREIQFEEVNLSRLSHSRLWKQSGRWDNTELFKLKDVKGADYCLVATCEEEITDLVNNNVQSYKQLPVKLFQLGTKFRDEKRPRAGLLRGREFVMKDGYSFHSSKKEALETFEDVQGAYSKIFKDLSIPVVAAKADSGSIGGDMSTEWHALHESGEDVLLRCNSCASCSNVEKTVSSPPESQLSQATAAKVKYFLTKQKDTFVAMYFPADKTLKANNVLDEIDDLDLANCENKSNDEVLQDFLAANKDAAVQNVIRVIDPRCGPRTDLPDFPAEIPFQRNSFVTLEDISICEATEGDICGDCGKGELSESKAIELGHTFYLGTKYSGALDANFQDKHDKQQFFEMGCYGIGISRLVAAIATIFKDARGLVWPQRIAPYQVSVINGPSLPDTQAVNEKVAQMVDTLKEKYDVSVDLEKESLMGSKIAFSTTIGVPLLMIVGRDFPVVELEVRKRWNSQESWKQAYEEDRERLHWKYEMKNGFEKHFVDSQHVSEVIEILLRDL